MPQEHLFAALGLAAGGVVAGIVAECLVRLRKPLAPLRGVLALALMCTGSMRPRAGSIATGYGRRVTGSALSISVVVKVVETGVAIVCGLVGTGCVVDIDWRTTTLKDPDGNRVVVPNQKITAGIFTVVLPRREDGQAAPRSSGGERPLVKSSPAPD